MRMRPWTALDAPPSARQTEGGTQRPQERGPGMNAEVKGSTLPVLEMILDPGDVLISDHGELSWMTSNVQMSQTTKMGNQQGGGGGLLGGLKRVLAGTS